MNKKKMNLANFNVTFGKENKPMLTFFDTIVYPAFKSEEHVKSSNTKNTYFFFENVEIKEYGDGDYILVGNIIKKTQVEVKTDYVNGKLVEKNEIHSTAPFSRFIIFLKNHRMILIKNEKDSPTLKNLEYTFDKNAKTIIKNHNNSLLGNKDKTLRYPSIITNVIALPIADTVKEVLAEVEKINTFKLRLFPLNGDLDFSDLCRDTRDFIDSTGAKTGSIIVNSPQSKSIVSDIIDTSSGLVECSLGVKFKNGLTGTIQSQKLNGTMECEVAEINISEYSDSVVIEQVKDNPGMGVLSEENKNIFEKSIDLIKSLIKN